MYCNFSKRKSQVFLTNRQKVLQMINSAKLSFFETPCRESGFTKFDGPQPILQPVELGSKNKREKIKKNIWENCEGEHRHGEGQGQRV